MSDQKDDSLMKPLTGNATESPPKNAATDKTKDGTASQQFKLLLLVMMVAQNSSTVLVGRHTRSSVPKEELYSVNHLICTCEMLKFILSCALEYQGTNGQLMSSIQLHILDRPVDALKILVPALLYLLQNTLLYVALSNLTAPIFQVTYQAKLVTTAVVSVIMLQRKYSFQQWVCLVFLSLGVATVVLGEKGGSKDNEESGSQNLFVGLVSVTTACFSSALAGVYFEYVVKKPAAAGQTAPAPSLWMRNMQLAFFSVCIAIGQGIFQSAKQTDVPAGQGYFHGFTFWVWVLVSLQAGGGLLVAAVIKYADNVLKGMATGVSVVTSTACSFFLFGTALTGQFVIGAVMILISVYGFSNPLPMPGGANRAFTLPK
ncbi:UDP-galactose translocator [Seminavis robusta]|uniref:UDP-galactose translocator n=1 Tax=Seminavis robusta TaxID=568900 RepID=A0A9N8ESM4_9STRA|nr:UDP-galactose translocator [Seminavis robusta]|eukprot:Sro1582_g283850.1 UDP-galactose translocator (373) ;mRNA; f:16017-17268